MSASAERPSGPPELARRLLDRETGLLRDGEPEQVGAALQRTFLRVSGNLRDTLGADGWAALLARALARTEADHPALQGFRPPGGTDLDLDARRVVAVHGIATTTAAVEALLAAVIEILGRLIGEDMTLRIIDHDTPGPHAGGEAQAP